MNKFNYSMEYFNFKEVKVPRKYCFHKEGHLNLFLYTAIFQLQD